MYKLVLVNFPFTEKRRFKNRPSLLLTSKSYSKHKLVLVAYVTSKKSECLESELKIRKSKLNHLEKDSYVLLHKIVNLEEKNIIGELGELTDKESKEVKAKLKKLFDL